MSKIHGINVRNAFAGTEGMFHYANPQVLNSLAWYKGDLNEDFDPNAIVPGWGAARFPIASPGLHVSINNYREHSGDMEKRYETFPKRDTNAVSENGAVYTRYSFIQTVKMFDWDRKFPTQKQAVKILSEYIATLSEGVPIEAANETCIKDGTLYLQNADAFEDTMQYFQHAIFWLVLFKEGGAAEKFHLKRITADIASALALAAVGVQAKATDDRYVAQLRNVFFAFPKKFTYASYNAEKYLRLLAC